MTSSDLLFVLLIVSTLAVIPISVVAFARHQRRRAAGWLGIAAGVWVGYVAAGFAVAVSTPQRVLARNEERCFDEICYRIAFLEKQGNAWTVTLTTRSRGRGRTERERGAEAFLMDGAGARYWPVGQSGAGLDAAVAPGESVSTRLRFEVPETRHGGLGLVVDHAYAINPGRIIIGDDEHLGHNPTIIRLE